MTFRKDEAVLETAHAHCKHNRRELENSTLASCFYCLEVFDAHEVEKWVDTGTTACCPKCGVDSVIGSDSGLDVDNLLWLSLMHKRWFDCDPIADSIVGRYKDGYK